jgi:phage terminase small subunit
MRKRLIKMAYKTPPQENWNEFRDPQQRNENYITDEHYARLADAGFTHGMGLLEHGADVAIRALTMAEKYGVDLPIYRKVVAELKARGIR